MNNIHAPRHKIFVFDIETGPLPDDELRKAMPPFNPDDVKLGNTKDPDKVALKIAEAQASYFDDCKSGAALDATLGRVLAIGMLDIDAPNDPPLILSHDNEATMLTAFWGMITGEMGRVHRLIGFNSWSFDLPFLIRRSWAHGIQRPYGIRKGRYWADEMIDLRETWKCGEYQARGTLDGIAKLLGCGCKTGHGGDFAKLWVEDRPKAEEYLRNDVRMTYCVGVALGDVPKQRTPVAVTPMASGPDDELPGMR